MENSTLLNARKNIYSQNGEDGVTELLIDFLDIKEGSFCEFGAWDGKYLSNTFNLLQNRNWKGVYIEGDEGKYQDLLQLKNEFGDRVQTINAYVDHKGQNTLDNLKVPINKTIDDGMEKMTQMIDKGIRKGNVFGARLKKDTQDALKTVQDRLAPTGKAIATKSRNIWDSIAGKKRIN